MNLITLIFILIAYLLGSISSAILICKLMKLPDPRLQGSGNPGATNVLRIGGKSPAFFAFLGDMLEGSLPVWFAQWAGLSLTGVCLVAIAAFLGHLFPVYYRFRGGKGVATAFGCLIALAWPAGLVMAFTWLTVAMVTRYSSLAALVSAVLAPFYMWFFTKQPHLTLAVIFMSLLLIYKHRSNIQKLLAGTESKLGKGQRG